MASQLIPPHGGTLVQLLADAPRARELEALARDCPSWTLTPRQTCDLELLLCGGFSPLTGFLTQEDYDSVCDYMRLADGTLWPIPVVFDLPKEAARQLGGGSVLFLRGADGAALAALHVESVWQPDRRAEAERVYGTAHPEHPAVDYLLRRSGDWYVGGRVEGIRAPMHPDFAELRRTPAELRKQFASLGWSRVVAFQTRNPMHRAHVELTFRAAEQCRAKVLIHPVVGLTKPGDVDYCTRIRCCQAVLKYYPPNTAMLSLLPLAMRMGGPREAVWHAIIRKNYGCTHLIVGRDHAGVGDYYGPFDAQKIFHEIPSDALVLKPLPLDWTFYCYECGTMASMKTCPHDSKAVIDDEGNYKGGARLLLSGTLLRKLMSEGKPVPPEFSKPEVIAVLKEYYDSLEQKVEIKLHGHASGDAAKK